MRKPTFLLTLGLALGLPTTAAAADGPEEEGSEASASASLSLGGDSSANASSSSGSRDDAKNVYMGAEVSRVASSFEDDDIFDIHFGVGYDFMYKRAAVLREWNSGAAGDTQNRLVKDLIYEQLRHTVTPTLEIGLWHDLAVYLTMPIVVGDSRFYTFDQRVDDCIFGDQPNATCTNKDNSTAIRDGIIPRDGFDATSSAAPFSQFTGAGTDLIFQGPQRRGLDQLHVGVKYGILNQQKRSHMPNWIIAGEGRFAVGRAQTFRRDITLNVPDGNQRVGRRIHELGVWTALSPALPLPRSVLRRLLAAVDPRRQLDLPGLLALRPAGHHRAAVHRGRGDRLGGRALRAQVQEHQGVDRHLGHRDPPLRRPRLLGDLGAAGG